MVVDKRFGDFTLGRTVVGPWKEEFERIRTHLTPLECEIIVGSIPAGAISRKGGSIRGMSVEINEDHAELKGSLTELMVSMDTMLKSTEGFRDTVHGIPRISSELVRCRKETERVLQELIDVTSGAKTSLQRALSLLP